MKNIIIATLVICIAACNSGGFEKATDPQDAGREFIRASLDGDHKKARFYLLNDSVNLLLMQRLQRDYERLNREDKRKHREASIRPVTIQEINDSTTIYRYYNTYNPKDTTTLTVVKSGDAWLVDLKSIFKP